MNFWDKLMDTDEGAANYMVSYGEGSGSEGRLLVGEFINDGESVLDVGCGPGWNFDHFRDYGPEISNYKGLDYSKRFVRVANERAPGFFSVGDCRRLREKKDSWDVVILQDVLEHTNGYEKPMRQALRVAKKRIIITFWRGFVSETTIKDSGDDGWEAAYSKDEWEEFLDSTGYFWTETETEMDANRWHHVYCIDKEEAL